MYDFHGLKLKVDGTVNFCRSGMFEMKHIWIVRWYIHIVFSKRFKLNEADMIKSRNNR